MLVSFIGDLRKDENDVREFHVAQIAAQKACDALAEYGLQDTTEIDNMRSSIEGAARGAATRMGVRTFALGVGSADRSGAAPYG